MLASLKKKETYTHYLETLRYALYVITHPLDGFWDLTHEKRGSIAAANTIVLLTVLARIKTSIYELCIYAGLLGRNQYFPIYCKCFISAGIVLCR